MSQVPEDLRYTRTHEWIRVEDGNIGTVGITDYAQEELGDIIMIELPPILQYSIVKGDKVGSIEAVKTVADYYAPVDGEIIAKNEKLEDTPDLINQDPYGQGWIFKMKITNPEQLNELMTAEEYKKFIEEEDVG